MTPRSFEEVRALTDVPVVVVNQDSVIAEVNAAFVKAFGWSREEAVGRSLSLIIPPTLRDAHTLGFARFLASGVSTILGRSLQLATIDRSGREFPAEHYVVGEKKEGAWWFAASIRPG